MAFSVKQIKAILSENGMPVDNLDKVAEEICSRHAADLDSIKEERDALRKDSETLKSVQKELDELKSHPDDGFKEKYEKIKKDFDAFKTETEAEKTLTKKKVAFEEICKDAGLNEKGVAKAMKYTDWDSVELDDSGKVRDAKDHIKNLKEEWAEHISTETTTGANTPNPPINTSGAPKSREDIYKTDEHGRFLMNASERQAALAQINAAEQQKG